MINHSFLGAGENSASAIQAVIRRIKVKNGSIRNSIKTIKSLSFIGYK